MMRSRLLSGLHLDAFTQHYYYLVRRNRMLALSWLD